MSKRCGRSYMVEDKGMISIIELIPIIPRGYIFMRDDKLMYGGMVFNLQDADARIDAIAYAMDTRAYIHGNKGFAFIEITDKMPEQPPIPAPIGCIFVSKLSDDKEEKVYPMLPAHNEDLKAEERPMSVVVSQSEEEEDVKPTK